MTPATGSPLVPHWFLFRGQGGTGSRFPSLREPEPVTTGSRASVKRGNHTIHHTTQEGPNHAHPRH